jgi:acetyl esterase/lipase
VRLVHLLIPALHDVAISPAAKSVTTLCLLSPLRIVLDDYQTTLWYHRTMIESFNAKGLPSESGCTVQRELIAGIDNYWIYANSWKNQPKEGFVLYIHGGGWTTGSLPLYETFLCRWSRRFGLPALFVDYPLAPENNVTIRTQLHSIVNVLKEVEPKFTKNIVISGDSAGGHLSLLLGQHLTQFEPKLRKKIAALGLISPAADLSGKGESWTNNADKDTMLSQKSFFMVTHLASGLKPNMTNLTRVPKRIRNDPNFNPTARNASFKDIPPVRIVAGAHEFFASDAQLVHKRVLESGGNSSLLIGAYMQHIYIVADGIFPEATKDAESFQASINSLLT